MFFLIIFSIPLATLLFWYLADRRLRARRHRQLVAARLGLAVFMVFQIGFFAAIILSRRMGWGIDIPLPVAVVGYVWFLAVLPVFVMPLCVVLLGEALVAGARWVRSLRAEPRQPTPQPSREATLTRREMLSLCIAATPPLLTLAGAGVAAGEINDFRVRSIDAPIPGLPAALDGFRIVHLSDTHVGRFTGGPLLDRMADAINGMDADLVAVTGDVIDQSIGDLPEATAMLTRLTARHGVYVCEGNHDLFEGRDKFESGVRGAGLNLLLNSGTIIESRGHRIELLGLRWGVPGGGRGAALEENMAAIAAVRDPRADVSILMAHHPHAFDLAQTAGIALTLAGHTHGGQLMLFPGFGVGSMIFKYCSGLYRAAGAALVVSNGAGNWMPLRINAPAEIVEVTLRRAADAATA